MSVQQSAGPVSVHCCEGVEGADFPSVSLVTGGGRTLANGALACTFTRWGRGALSLTQLYCHKNTAPITTTLSRALREREREERELSQALSPGQNI